MTKVVKSFETRHVIHDRRIECCRELTEDELDAVIPEWEIDKPNEVEENWHKVYQLLSDGVDEPFEIATTAGYLHARLFAEITPASLTYIGDPIIL